jgi:enoyl-CoA hydratase
LGQCHALLAHRRSLGRGDGISDGCRSGVAPNKTAATEVAIGIANRIAACGPLGIKATLEAAHLVINDSADAAGFEKLEAAYVSLFRSEDFA